MPFITYNENEPLATDPLSVSQGKLQQNTNAVNQIVDVDHYSFGNNDGGLHKQVTLPANNVPSAFPTSPVIFANNEDGTGSGLPGGLSQLFFYTGTALQSKNQYVSAQTGSTMLPGGIILKWAKIGGLIIGANNTVSFTQGSFPNACFSVVVTGADSGNAQSFFNVNNKTVNDFQVFCGAAGNIYYLAIGN